jgi:hypothetical protein
MPRVNQTMARRQGTSGPWPHADNLHRLRSYLTPDLSMKPSRFGIFT